MSGKVHRIQRAKAAERILKDVLCAIRREGGLSGGAADIIAARAMRAGYTTADLDAHEARRLAQQEAQA